MQQVQSPPWSVHRPEHKISLNLCLNFDETDGNLKYWSWFQVEKTTVGLVLENAAFCRMWVNRIRYFFLVSSQSEKIPQPGRQLADVCTSGGPVSPPETRKNIFMWFLQLEWQIGVHVNWKMWRGLNTSRAFLQTSKIKYLAKVTPPANNSRTLR